MRTVGILVYLLLGTFFVLSQDASELLAHVQKNYDAKAVYQTELVYSLFKGHNSEIVDTSYKAYSMVQTENRTYQRIGDVEYVYEDGTMLEIDNASHTMLLSNSKKSQDMIALEELITMASGQELELKDDFYNLSLSYESNMSSSVSKVQMLIGKTDFLIRQIDVFYTQVRDFSKESATPEYHLPHVRVSYENFNKDIKPSLDTHKLASYIVIRGATATPNERYKDYQLFDHRIR